MERWCDLSRAICTDILHFRARVLVIQPARAATGERRGSWTRFWPFTGTTARSASRKQSPPDARGPRVLVVGTRSALPDQAAASIEGHVPQTADRFASRRARRAAAARAVRSAGTPSPVLKYISSGVCPRNAEWGTTRLCKSTTQHP